MLKIVLALLVVCVGLVVSSTSDDDDAIGADVVPEEELPLALPLALATNSTPTGKQGDYRRPGDYEYCEDENKRCGIRGNEGVCRLGGCLNDEYECRDSRNQCEGSDCACCKPRRDDPYRSSTFRPKTYPPPTNGPDPNWDCKDNFPDCPDFRRACTDIYDKSHTWALSNCLRTCNLCERAPDNTRDHDCFDKFTSDGYGNTCNNYISQCYDGWVRLNCRRTCNLCGSGPGSDRCADRRPRAYCEAARNDCDYDYIADDCPATCNKCNNRKDEGPGSSRCEDRRPWAYCDANRYDCHIDYIADDCPDTCNKCNNNHGYGARADFIATDFRANPDDDHQNDDFQDSPPVYEKK